MKARANETTSVGALQRPLDTFPVLIQEQAFRRKAYVDAWLSKPDATFTKEFVKPVILRTAKIIGDPSPPSATSLYRWVRIYRSSGNNIYSLIPSYHKRGSHNRHFNTATQEICNRIINDYYLTKQRLSIKEVHRQLTIAISRAKEGNTTNEKVSLPSYDTVRRIINGIDKYEADLARFGREYTRKKYRHSYISDQPDYILERVECDHTPLNIFIIDDEYLVPLGRPHLSWTIDVMSRMITGFYVSFSPPSIKSVFECLKHAISSKDYIKEKYPDIQHDWPCHGVPHNLVVDNGQEFHTQDLVRATTELQINYQFCAPRTPWEKPFVERSFRTLAQQFESQLPGNSFASYLHRFGYDPLHEATMTFRDLMHALHIWVIDIYAQSYHLGLNSTPYTFWNKYAEASVLRDFDISRLQLTLTRECERVLGHIGIEIHGLRYNSPELLLIRKQFGDRIKVRIRYDTDNLDFIFVLHPSTLEPIRVPCLQASYAENLTLYQHKKIQAFLRAEGRSTSDTTSLNKARELMMETIGSLVRDKKLKQRKKGARLTGLNSANKESREAHLNGSRHLPDDGPWSHGSDDEAPPLSLPVIGRQPGSQNK